jgi:branched-chain amino acid transport system ATP-binding protein
VSPLAAPTEVATGVLEAVDLAKRFGGVEALRGVSVNIPERRIVGLIGPNGSGKTTLLNCLSGVFLPTSGSVLLDGESIARRGGHRIARAGVVRTFQNIRLFGGLSALQNVEVGALGAGRVRRAASRDYAAGVLEQLGIAHLADRWASTLSYGDQRRVEVARALAGVPRFLLLDEPAAGMNEQESEELRKAIQQIRLELECGILVVEHDLSLIMRLCDTVYVLSEGRVISYGTPEEVRSDPAVIAAYIGEEERYVDSKGSGE